MLKIQYMIYAISILLVLTGCTDTSTERSASNEQPVQPIHYEENKEQMPSENNAGRQNGPPSLDSYDKDESAAFQEMLRENIEVEDVQVVTTADRVVVAVQMKKGTDHRDFEEVSDDIEHILNTDKKLFIYNNVAKWERVKDFNARNEANQMGEDVEHLFQNLFE
ncbi:YhcN/YlaJ family sporulation lipoprotein [Oceanobacillus sojae]|uniref:YhcN/YlaJ family sporulation lipoprotein n=1 Tax=Oceanobacillus sojae TaxID=582851 RepID=UPI0021A3AB3B|nr:YhcN/YlaJ family sporulation lipoprotein [Oceanobacillus sojae]MCT1903356.1 YhcN/YlaJ family sporulation lipoprotein [Oceanobacillus sojae]